MYNRISNKIVKYAQSLWDHIEFEIQSSPNIITLKVIADQEGRELVDYDPTTFPQWDLGQIGTFAAVNEPVNLLKDECRQDFDAMQRWVGRDLGVFRTGFVKLLPGAQGYAIGTEMYVEVAKACATYDAVLVPDRCLSGGQTTPEADRVWESRSIRQRLDVEGNNVFWGGRR